VKGEKGAVVKNAFVLVHAVMSSGRGKEKKGKKEKERKRRGRRRSPATQKPVEKKERREGRMDRWSYSSIESMSKPGTGNGKNRGRKESKASLAR